MLSEQNSPGFLKLAKKFKVYRVTLNRSLQYFTQNKSIEIVAINYLNPKSSRSASYAARSGFETEDLVVAEFNNWKASRLARGWLAKISDSPVASVMAKNTRRMGNPKADVLLRINDTREVGISVKKFEIGYNQIDKRWAKTYRDMWDIPNDVFVALRKYCGRTGYRPSDLEPGRNTKDHRRYYISELAPEERSSLIRFFEQRSSMILGDILRGNTGPEADYMLVVKRRGRAISESAICKIEDVIKHFDGPIKITSKDNLKIGKVTAQRKGGDTGKKSAQMLQFKFSPNEVFKIRAASTFRH